MSDDKSAAVRDSIKRWKRANPEKKRAHCAVQKAIARGHMDRKPCERCGTNKDVHAHHEDYLKRLEVTWLCRKHHLERHREIADRQNNGKG